MVDDKTLILEFLDGNVESFNTLILQHEGWMHGMILQVVRHKEDTEDLCQDIFVKVYFNNKSEILELRHTHHKEIGDVLTDEQTIKYVIFDYKFKKKMKDQLLDKRSHRGPGE